MGEGALNLPVNKFLKVNKNSKTAIKLMWSMIKMFTLNLLKPSKNYIYIKLISKDFIYLTFLYDVFLWKDLKPWKRKWMKRKNNIFLNLKKVERIFCALRLFTFKYFWDSPSKICLLFEHKDTNTKIKRMRLEKCKERRKK